MKKRLIALITFFTLTIPNASAFAGTWVQKGTDYKGGICWKYKNDNGKYTKDEWQLIDGEWYHFTPSGSMEYNETIYYELSNGADDVSKPKYYVGADGKMLKGGWYKRDNTYSIFTDNTGKIAEGLFFVDGTLYNNVEPTKHSGATRLINMIWCGKTFVEYIDKNGNKKEIQLEINGGKVINYGNLLNDIKYVPIYNSQGQLIGAIQN